MRVLVTAAVLAGALGLALPAWAGPGQCYDAYGRPVGPVYDTDNPNYGFINSVIRRGGSCTGVQPGYDSDRRNRRYYESPRYHDSQRYRRDRDYDSQRGPRDPHTGTVYPHSGTPGLGSCTYADPARCGR
jgi:hypothetical protein